MARRYDPAFRFILADKVTGRFPKIDTAVISERLLADTLEYTYVYDDRDNPVDKVGYFNALYKGIAEFEVFTFGEAMK